MSEVVAECNSTVHSKIIEAAGPEPSLESYEGRLAMLVVYRAARKAEQDPQLYLVTHRDDSPEMEVIFRTACVGFIHPELGSEEPEWCFNRKKLHRKVFLQWYRSKRDEATLRNLRTCLTQNGGIGAPDGLIEDSKVDWPATVDCADAKG